MPAQKNSDQQRSVLKSLIEFTVLILCESDRLPSIVLIFLTSENTEREASSTRRQE
jgi:hypothetical protein